MKNFLLKICILNISMLLVMFMGINLEANADGKSMLTSMTSQAQKFETEGSSQASGIDWQSITTEFVSLAQILTMVGTGVLIAVIAYMGIKYLTSGPEAQAKLKVQLIGIVVAGVVILGAYGIWQLVINIASQF